MVVFFAFLGTFICARIGPCTSNHNTLQDAMMTKIFLSLVSAIAILVFPYTALDGSAAPVCNQPAENDIDNISTELLMKEIELLKLNTRLRIYLLPHKLWSTRRWSGVGITNVTLTAIGALMNGAGRLHYLDNPKKAPQSLFLNASKVRFLANCISMGGATFESGADLLSGCLEKRRGVDLSAMRSCANRLQREIDELIDRREALLASSDVTGRAKDVLKREAVLLTDLRNADVNEFAYYYSQARGNRLARQANYLITFASNFTSAAGTLVGIESIRMQGLSGRRRAHMGAVGGICDIVSGSINIAAPAATRCVGALQRRFARKAICEKFDCEQSNNINSLLEHKHAYLSEIARGPTSVVRGEILRKPALDAATAVLEKRFEMRAQDWQRAKMRFYENSVTALVAGGSKITNGIGSTVAAYKFTDDPQMRFAIQGGTAIAYGVGNAAAAAENIRVQLGNEIKGYRNSKERKGTEYILKQELEELEHVSVGSQVASTVVAPGM